MVDDDDDVFEENIKEKPRVPEVINSVPSTSSFPKQYDGEEVNMKEVNTVTIDDQEEPEVVFSPPCITIAEQEGAQPLQIQVSIAGKTRTLREKTTRPQDKLGLSCAKLKASLNLSGFD